MKRRILLISLKLVFIFILFRAMGWILFDNELAHNYLSYSVLAILLSYCIELILTIIDFNLDNNIILQLINVLKTLGISTIFNTIWFLFGYVFISNKHINDIIFIVLLIIAIICNDISKIIINRKY